MVRDSIGWILSQDHNQAKVYAMLMGCHQLLKIEGYNAIIEGDSFFCYSLWVKEGKMPMAINNWIDEVHMIARQLHCSFNYVLRDGNVLADGLAR